MKPRLCFFLKKPSLVKLSDDVKLKEGKPAVIIDAVYQPHYRVLMFACVSVCVCLSVCKHDNSKNNGLIYLKLEYIVVHENSSKEFDIGHCPIKVKIMA